MRVMKFILCLLLVLGMSIAAQRSAAGPLEDGWEAVSRNDYVAALRIWQPLAERGIPGGQYCLGFLYENGRGVPQDYVLAYMWLNLAASSGDPASAMYRDRLAAMMTSSQVAEAQRLTREWKPRRQ